MATETNKARRKFQPYSREDKIKETKQPLLTKAEVYGEAVKLYKARKLEEADALIATIPSPSDCTCQGWGCYYCCLTSDEIRSRQGTFG